MSDFASEAFESVKFPLNSRVLLNAAKSGLYEVPKSHFLIGPAILTLAVQYQKSIDRDIEKRRNEAADLIAAFKKGLRK